LQIKREWLERTPPADRFSKHMTTRIKKMADNGPKLAPTPEPEEAVSIAKPGAFDLDKFKSKSAAALANVETLQTALPVHSIAEAKDFVRLRRGTDAT
jgi:hypothetical protein